MRSRAGYSKKAELWSLPSCIPIATTARGQTRMDDSLSSITTDMVTAGYSKSRTMIITIMYTNCHHCSMTNQNRWTQTADRHPVQVHVLHNLSLWAPLLVHIEKLPTPCSWPSEPKAGNMSTSTPVSCRTTCSQSGIQLCPTDRLMYWVREMRCELDLTFIACMLYYPIPARLLSLYSSALSYIYNPSNILLYCMLVSVVVSNNGWPVKHPWTQSRTHACAAERLCCGSTGVCQELWSRVSEATRGY